MNPLLQLFFDFLKSGHRYVAAHSAACHFLCVTPTHGSNSIFRIPAITLTLPTFLYIVHACNHSLIVTSPVIITWQHIVLLVVFLPSLPHHGSNSICQVPAITPMPLNIYTSLPIYLIDFVAAHSAPCRSLCVDPPHGSNSIFREFRQSPPRRSTLTHPYRYTESLSFILSLSYIHPVTPFFFLHVVVLHGTYSIFKHLPTVLTLQPSSTYRFASAEKDCNAASLLSLHPSLVFIP